MPPLKISRGNVMALVKYLPSWGFSVLPSKSTEGSEKHFPPLPAAPAGNQQSSQPSRTRAMDQNNIVRAKKTKQSLELQLTKIDQNLHAKPKVTARRGDINRLKNLLT